MVHASSAGLVWGILWDFEGRHTDHPSLPCDDMIRLSIMLSSSEGSPQDVLVGECLRAAPLTWQAGGKSEEAR